VPSVEASSQHWHWCTSCQRCERCCGTLLLSCCGCVDELKAMSIFVHDIAPFVPAVSKQQHVNTVARCLDIKARTAGS
jgi:hypothetical protein